MRFEEGLEVLRKYKACKREKCAQDKVCSLCSANYNARDLLPAIEVVLANIDAGRGSWTK